MHRKIIISFVRIAATVLSIFFVYLFLYGIWAYRIESLNIYIIKIMAGLIGLLLTLLAYEMIKRKLSLSALDTREALSDDEIYRHFYAGSGLSKAAVIDVWHEVARTLHVPAERLQPTDRFGKDVGVYWITSEELDTLGVVAQERAKRQGVTVDLASIETVDDYVKRLTPRN